MIYSLIEAGKLLGLSPETLRVYARKGKIKAKKLGRDWFIEKSAIEKFRNRKDMRFKENN